MIFTRTRARWKKAEPAKPADELEQWEDDGGLVYSDPTSIEQRAVEQDGSLLGVHPRYREEGMEVQRLIDAKVREAFSPSYFELTNESSMHNVPPGSESHFRLLIVSEGFRGRSRVQRHESVYRVLTEELDGPVHALGLQTFTEDEWAEEQQRLESPPCLGGDSTRQS